MGSFLKHLVLLHFFCTLCTQLEVEKRTDVASGIFGKPKRFTPRFLDRKLRRESPSLTIPSAKSREIKCVITSVGRGCTF